MRASTGRSARVSSARPQRHAKVSLATALTSYWAWQSGQATSFTPAPAGENVPRTSGFSGWDLIPASARGSAFQRREAAGLEDGVEALADAPARRVDSREERAGREPALDQLGDRIGDRRGEHVDAAARGPAQARLD